MKKKYSRILLLIFFSLFINSKIFAEIKFKEVVVTGIGQSLEEATNNAFAEAISMVNGKNVQTKTIIKATIGRKNNWLIKPIIKFLGAFTTLAKSENVKPKPRVNIIKAKAKGRITSVMKFIDKY